MTFHQRVLLATKKQFKMHQNAINCDIKPFEESEGLTGRGQTKEDWHMAVTPVNIKFVKDYFTTDLSSICTVSHNCDLSYSL